jgi:hypothetical protein
MVMSLATVADALLGMVDVDLLLLQLQRQANCDTEDRPLMKEGGKIGSGRLEANLQDGS